MTFFVYLNLWDIDQSVSDSCNQVSGLKTLLKAKAVVHKLQIFAKWQQAYIYFVLFLTPTLKKCQITLTKLSLYTTIFPCLFNFIMCITVLPAKNDSDVIFCLQLLSKTLTCTLHLS